MEKPLWLKPLSEAQEARLTSFPLQELRHAYVRQAASDQLLSTLAESVKPMFVPKRSGLTPERMNEIVRRLGKTGERKKIIDGLQNEHVDHSFADEDIAHCIVSQAVLSELGVYGKERDLLEAFLGVRHYRDKNPLWSPLSLHPLEGGLLYLQHVGRVQAIQTLKKMGELVNAFRRNYVQYADHARLARRKSVEEGNVFTKPLTHINLFYVEPMLEFLGELPQGSAGFELSLLAVHALNEMRENAASKLYAKMKTAEDVAHLRSLEEALKRSEALLKRFKYTEPPRVFVASDGRKGG